MQFIIDFLEHKSDTNNGSIDRIREHLHCSIPTETSKLSMTHIFKDNILQLNL